MRRANEGEWKAQKYVDLWCAFHKRLSALYMYLKTIWFV